MYNRAGTTPEFKGDCGLHSDYGYPHTCCQPPEKEQSFAMMTSTYDKSKPRVTGFPASKSETEILMGRCEAQILSALYHPPSIGTPSLPPFKKQHPSGSSAAVSSMSPPRGCPDKWHPGHQRADDLNTQVVWRTSEDQFWTEMVPVGKVTSATARLSKDNTRCGVHAQRANFVVHG
ncbi:hypothetical protein B0H17DRAFT_1138558 [Mycena rosella]|uniref:Uncharacterized protein n=1 Tax=Mycena rosella TaxID=1033263 RepID=A0AAD7GC45_MYCRO|nr:hypothetical protein B0H17DRAFT_1138558 [Mycena rosella]